MAVKAERARPRAYGRGGFYPGSGFENMGDTTTPNVPTTGFSQVSPNDNIFPDLWPGFGDNPGPGAVDPGVPTTQTMSQAVADATFGPVEAGYTAAFGGKDTVMGNIGRGVVGHLSSVPGMPFGVQGLTNMALNALGKVGVSATPTTTSLTGPISVGQLSNVLADPNLSLEEFDAIMASPGPMGTPGMHGMLDTGKTGAIGVFSAPGVGSTGNISSMPGVGPVGPVGIQAHGIVTDPQAPQANAPGPPAADPNTFSDFGVTGNTPDAPGPDSGNSGTGSGPGSAGDAGGAAGPGGDTSGDGFRRGGWVDKTPRTGFQGIPPRRRHFADGGLVGAIQARSALGDTPETISADHSQSALALAKALSTNSTRGAGALAGVAGTVGYNAAKVIASIPGIGPVVNALATKLGMPLASPTTSPPSIPNSVVPGIRGAFGFPTPTPGHRPFQVLPDIFNTPRAPQQSPKAMGVNPPGQPTSNPGSVSGVGPGAPTTTGSSADPGNPSGFSGIGTTDTTGPTGPTGPTGTTGISGIADAGPQADLSEGQAADAANAAAVDAAASGIGQTGLSLSIDSPGPGVGDATGTTGDTGDTSGYKRGGFVGIGGNDTWRDPRFRRPQQLARGGLVDKTKRGLDPDIYAALERMERAQQRQASLAQYAGVASPVVGSFDAGSGAFDFGAGTPGTGGDGSGGDGGDGSGGDGGFAHGGFVNIGNPQSQTDDVPAMLQHGEYVVPRPAMQKLAEKTGGYQQAARKVKEMIIKFASDGKSSVHFKESDGGRGERNRTGYGRGVDSSPWADDTLTTVANTLSDQIRSGRNKR